MMTADEVYEALKELRAYTDFTLENLDERCAERLSELENRVQLQIDGIRKRLDERGGPVR